MAGCKCNDDEEKVRDRVKVPVPVPKDVKVPSGDKKRVDAPDNGLSLPPRAHVIVVPQDAGSPAHLSVDHIALVSAGRPLPLGAAGVVYAGNRSLAEGVREVLRHTDHYMRTAASFTSAWTDHHTPRKLERELVARQGHR